MKTLKFQVYLGVIVVGFFFQILIGIPFYALGGEIIRVNEITIDLVPKGKSLDAIYGDWIMRNDKVVAVIGDAVYGREANMRVQSIQGAVIDFTSITDNNDFLAAYYPQGIPGPDSRKNPALFADSIVAIKSAGNEIQLDVYRKSTAALPFQCVTTYILKDGENFLRVRTTYFNDGEEDVVLTLSDKLRLDLDNTEAPAIGEHNLAFLYNKWFNAAYGVYNPNGLFITEPPITGSDPAVGLLVNHAQDEYKLRAGNQVTFERYLMYGRDVAEIQRDALAFGNQVYPVQTFQVADRNGQPLEDVFVEVFSKQDELISFMITDPKGESTLPLHEGTFKFVATKVGHDTVTTMATVSAGVQTFKAVMNPLTSLRIVARDGDGGMIPVKVEFKGVNGTPDPFLGTPKRAEGASNFYYAINNKEEGFVVPVSPGEYLVAVSHGPEYNVVSRVVNLAAGDTQEVEIMLSRMFNSLNWIIADIHNHTTRSGDNDSDTKGRIINMAASGIEFAPATEHNRISTYTDEIEQLGLTEYIASAPGIELTGPTGIVGGGPNHQNAFPLTIQIGKQGGGFPAIDGDVYTQLKRLYEHDADKPKLVQHNHPGYGIAKLYFDKDEDGEIDGGYATREFTDVMELQNYTFQILDVTNPGRLNENHPVFYWLQMLNQGDRIFGTTTSDGHYVGARSGERFTYIYAENDSAANLDAVEIAINTKKGHVVMSNGPFLDVTVNGSKPGEEVSQDVGKDSDIQITVYGNNEVVIDRVQFLLNGIQASDLLFTRSKHPELFSDSGLQFQHQLTLKLTEDTHIIAVATGRNVKKGVEMVEMAARSRPANPIAISNPIFVDVDGNGFVANKDTLGKSLPKGKIEVNERF